MLFVRALDSGEEKPLFETASRVQYAPPGYLLYVREDTLVAQPFDADARELTGEAVPVAEGLGMDAVGLAHFSASFDGTLAYRAGETRTRQLLWVDREGRELEAVGETGEYGDVWPSPDGTRLAFDMPEGGSGSLDLWIRDLARGVTSRFTFDAGSDSSPLWSPDGRTIVFTSDRGGVAGDLYEKLASGTGEEEVLLANEEEKYACDWSRDGRFLVYMSRGRETRWDVWALPMEGESEPFPIVKTRFREVTPSLSPDGKLVAYVSNESGQNEVYVQEFPEPRSKWQVSTGGGSDPHWRSDGREIFYRSPDAQIMSVPVQARGPFAAGAPTALFQARLQPAIVRSLYRPSADGQRFLTLAPLGRDSILPTTVVLNWAADLGTDRRRPRDAEAARALESRRLSTSQGAVSPRVGPRARASTRRPPRRSDRDRQDDLELQGDLRAGQGGHGRGLAGPGHEARPRRGPQGAPRVLRPGPREAGALRARGQGPRLPRPTPTSPASIGLEEVDGKRFLVMEVAEGETLSDRIARGPVPVADAVTHRHADRRGPRGRPREGHRPPRPEARQRHGHRGRRGEGPRLRPGQGHGDPSAVGKLRRGLDPVPHAGPRGHPGRDAPGDRGVHVPGAGPGQAGGPPGGHLGLRVRALRDAGGPQGLRRGDGHRRPGGHRPQGPGDREAPGRRPAEDPGPDRSAACRRTSPGVSSPSATRASPSRSGSRTRRRTTRTQRRPRRSQAGGAGSPGAWPRRSPWRSACSFSACWVARATPRSRSGVSRCAWPSRGSTSRTAPARCFLPTGDGWPTSPASETTPRSSSAPSTGSRGRRWRPASTPVRRTTRSSPLTASGWAS